MIGRSPAIRIPFLAADSRRSRQPKHEAQQQEHGQHAAEQIGANVRSSFLAHDRSIRRNRVDLRVRLFAAAQEFSKLPRRTLEPHPPIQGFCDSESGKEPTAWAVRIHCSSALI